VVQIIFVSLPLQTRNNNNNKKDTIMKILNFKSEKETENKVIELTLKGIRFETTGRRQIIIK
jgi:hypothetical protein